MKMTADECIKRIEEVITRPTKKDMVRLVGEINHIIQDYKKSERSGLKYEVMAFCDGFLGSFGKYATIEEAEQVETSLSPHHNPYVRVIDGDMSK